MVEEAGDWTFWAGSDGRLAVGVGCNPLILLINSLLKTPTNAFIMQRAGPMAQCVHNQSTEHKRNV